MPTIEEVPDDGPLALEFATERITLQLCRNSKGQLGMCVRDDNFVAVVDGGGGAHAAGIYRGDWIVAIGREPHAVEVDDYQALLPYLKATRPDVATSVVVRYSKAQHPDRRAPRPPSSPPMLAANLSTGGSRGGLPAGLPPSASTCLPPSASTRTFNAFSNEQTTTAASASTVETTPHDSSPRRRHGSSHHARSSGTNITNGSSPSSGTPRSGGSPGDADGGSGHRRRRRTYQREEAGQHHRGAESGAAGNTASRPSRPQLQLHQTFDNLPAMPVVGTSAHEPVAQQHGHGSGRRRRSHHSSKTAHDVHRDRGDGGDSRLNDSSDV